jgi:hypothetical protein
MLSAKTEVELTIKKWVEDIQSLHDELGNKM